MKNQYYNNKYQYNEELHQVFKDTLIQEIPSINKLEVSRKVLDIGCGTGLNSKIIRELGYDVQGIDISDEAIKRYNLNGFHGQVFNIDEGLPFEDNTFDLVFMAEVIEHLVNPEFAIEEIHRILKKENGILLISTPNSSLYIYRFLHLLGYTSTELQHPYHLRFFSFKTFNRLLEEKQFKVIKSFGNNIYALIPEKLIHKFSKILGLNIIKVDNFLKKIGFKYEKGLIHGGKYMICKKSKIWASFFSNVIIIKAVKE